MKIKTKKNRPHKYEISRPRSRHGHNYRKHKRCLSMVMLLCIRQHLSNICLSNTEARLKKSVGYKKSL